MARYRPPNERDPMDNAIKKLVEEAVVVATAPLVSKIKDLMAENKMLEARVASLEQRPTEEPPAEKVFDALEEVERAAADTDNNMRRSNVVVTGLRVPKGDAEPAARELFGRMGINLGPNDVTSARPLSAKEDAAIMVRFNHQKHAEAVLKAGRGISGVKIKPDYCLHTRRARGFLFGTF